MSGSKLDVMLNMHCLERFSTELYHSNYMHFPFIFFAAVVLTEMKFGKQIIQNDI